ncbi:CAP domain-containing protein [Blastococcus sp. CCUG 61487]|uniref:CAP domain-containing protein n=1 Tax=Blastococcus sp. CCUG 61487 TaxID=1840703 RepID=UPI00113D48C8|nr:CAP domain-containing protein [Blastococcus sp. CCUG 61487]TKJ35656.1 hypothetical protein A6V29_14200 [Blastococcus sp. CCUG 61487]
MHHRPIGPPLSTRLSGGATRTRLRAAAALHRRRGRLALGAGLAAVMTGFVLATPVVSGLGAPSSIAVESSAARSDSPVVMGIDGPVTSSAFASASARLTVGPDGVRVESSGRPSAPTFGAPAAPSTTPAEPPAAPPPPPPAPEPPVVEEAPAPPPAPAPAPQPSAAAPAPPPAAAPTGNPRADQVLALVNQARASAGCGPVSADAGLASVAAAHSADMRDRGFFDHVNLAGQDPFDRARAAGVVARAENIARGQADAAAVMDSWMNSPGHRANILDCGLTRLGVGIADGGGGPWWTQLFG